MESFVLLGHDCVFGHYPAPVIPVGAFGAELVVVYPGGQTGPMMEVIEKDRHFLHYPASMRGTLDGFQWQTHRLFAYSPFQVEYYSAIDESEFLTSFLLSANAESLPPTMRQLLIRAAAAQGASSENGVARLGS